MAWEARSGLKRRLAGSGKRTWEGLNGLGSPFGIETQVAMWNDLTHFSAKWPGKPVRD